MGCAIQGFRSAMQWWWLYALPGQASVCDGDLFDIETQMMVVDCCQQNSTQELHFMVSGTRYRTPSSLTIRRLAFWKIWSSYFLVSSARYRALHMKAGFDFGNVAGECGHVKYQWSLPNTKTFSRNYPCSQITGYKPCNNRRDFILEQEGLCRGSGYQVSSAGNIVKQIIAFSGFQDATMR